MEKIRYQYCSGLVKLFRRRWYLLIPIEALYFYIYFLIEYYKKSVDVLPFIEKGSKNDNKNVDAYSIEEVVNNENYKDYYSFSTCWSISVGIAQCRMEWLIDWEDIFEDIGD